MTHSLTAVWHTWLMWLRLMKMPIAHLKLLILFLMLRKVLAIANVTADSLTTTFLQFGDRLELLDFLTRFLRGLKVFCLNFKSMKKALKRKVLVGSESGPHCLLWLIPSVSEDFISTGRQNSVHLFHENRNQKAKLRNIRPLRLIPNDNVGDFSCNLFLRQNSVYFK